MPNIGAPELIVILVIALLIIGPGKLPDVGSALGKSIREFRKASSDVQEAAKIDTSPIPPPNASSTPPEPNVLHTPTAPPQSTPPQSTPPPTDSTSEQNH
jgi:sec-independent protein translocase protein TatA